MESKNYIKDIQMFINEAYSDKEPLQDNQVRSKKVFNDYCNKIKQDLEHYHNALQDKYDYSKCLCYDELLVRCKHLEKENQILNDALDIAKVDYTTTRINLDNATAKIKILEKENKNLKEKNKILNHNSTNIVMTDTKIMKRNLELQTENQELKEEIEELSKDKTCFERQCEKLEKAIEILKVYFKFTFNDNYLYMNITSKISRDGKGTTNGIQAVENYRLLKEVLE